MRWRLECNSCSTSDVVAVHGPLLSALIVRKLVAREDFADAHPVDQLSLSGNLPPVFRLRPLIPLAAFPAPTTLACTSTSAPRPGTSRTCRTQSS